MSDNGSDIGAFMAGFVIGGLVGAATALILAPQSGAETRAQIAARGEDIWQAGEQQFQDYRTKAESTYTEAQSRVQDTTSQVQERARIVLEEGKSKISAVSHKDSITEAEAESISKEEGIEIKIQGGSEAEGAAS